MLCHGRNHGFPCINDVSGNAVFKSEDCDFVTVDVNQIIWPHIAQDVLDASLFERLKADFDPFSYVFLFNCRCHTMNINNDQNIMNHIRSIMKPDGVLFLKDRCIFVFTSVGFEQVGAINEFTVNVSALSRYPLYAEVVSHFSMHRHKNVVSTHKPVKINLTKFVKCDLQKAAKDAEIEVHQVWYQEDLCFDDPMANHAVVPEIVWNACPAK